MTGPVVAMSLLAGGALGLGVWMVLAGLPSARSVRFVDRISPQLKVVDVRSRLLGTDAGRPAPFGPLGHILQPVLRDVVRRLDRFNPASSLLDRRLVQAGGGLSTTDFRARQILWAALGLGTSTALVVLAAGTGRSNIVFAAVLVPACTAGGYLFRDYLLSRQIAHREARMLAEFPSLAELMALAVSAGESATGALERVCRTARGELAGEFGRVLAETRAGTPVVEAFQEFSRRTQLAPLARFVDGLTVAVQRGTPLAEVLRAQAQDVRDMSKRELMESAGKKEIAMMIPLVFGVLPLTVLFAVYPGIALINLGF
ncbi:type II secretion system F family protein [Arthrobacter crusticola]|nr:type II secretion system F family protein [Arthrobacter crusticola]